MKSIVLIGYMCVGKTTIGRALAKELGMQFYDLDWYIEERFHKKVPQIFIEEGEEAFREKERNMLHEVASFENIVLACGGGTPIHFDNMDFLNKVATTVYLEASSSTILRHLKISHGNRPLLAQKTGKELEDFVVSQLAEREPYYKQAQHIFHIKGLDTLNMVEEVTENLKKSLHLVE